MPGRDLVKIILEVFPLPHLLERRVKDAIYNQIEEGLIIPNNFGEVYDRTRKLIREFQDTLHQNTEHKDTEHRGRSLPLSKRRQIKPTLELYNGNVAKTAQHLGLSKPTVRKYARAVGIEMPSVGGKSLPEEKRVQIRSILELYNWDIAKTAKHLGVSKPTVRKYARL